MGASHSSHHRLSRKDGIILRLMIKSIMTGVTERAGGSWPCQEAKRENTGAWLTFPFLFHPGLWRVRQRRHICGSLSSLVKPLWKSPHHQGLSPKGLVSHQVDSQGQPLPFPSCPVTLTHSFHSAACSQSEMATRPPSIRSDSDQEKGKWDKAG